MITTPTVLVLGAGASKPYGFPLGTQLVDRLRNHVVSYGAALPVPFGETAEVLLHPSFENPELLHAFRQELRLSRLFSIDAFLATRPEYADIGRAAIAATLIPHEIFDNLFNVESGDWYGYLRNQMGTTARDFHISASNLSIVTFNYDRSFEYYLHAALVASYQEQLAKELFALIKITHVYGQLGLPLFIDANGRDYTKETTQSTVQIAVSQIKVIPDNDATNGFQLAHQFISQADVLVFLGFGYSPENTSRLNVQQFFHGTRVYGTAFQLERGEIVRARALFLRNDNLQNRIVMVNTDSLGLLRAHDVLH